MFITRLLCFFCLFLCFPILARADVSVDLQNSTEWLLRDKAAKESLEQSLNNQFPPIQLPEVEPFSLASQESICFVINEIVSEGLLSQWIIDQGASLLGQCIGYKSIQEYLKVVQQKLLYDGYVTSRALLPEQNVSSGKIKIDVFEGKIESIVFPENYPYQWKNALPLNAGDTLNLRDMEQAVDHLNRLQSQDVSFKIEPGTQQGMSFLVAEVKTSKRLESGLSTDNGGSKLTGQYPLSIKGSVDHVFSLQDVLAVSTSFSRKSDSGESGSILWNWSAPFNYWLFTVSGNHFESTQHSKNSARGFEINNKGSDLSFRSDYVFFRDNKVKASMYSSLKKRKRSNFIDGAEIKLQRRDLNELELGVVHRRFFKKIIVNTIFSVHQGLPFLGGNKVLEGVDSKVAQPEYRFLRLTSNVSSSFKFFGRPVSYLGVVSLQYADTALYSLDWFANGGLYTVRGFSSNESLSSDSGWRLRNDLITPLIQGQQSLSSYLGLDVGQVSGDGNLDPNLSSSDKLLAGIALGIKGNVSNMNYDLSLSRPFIERGPHANSNNYEVSLSLSAVF